ncbi:MAG: tRNA (adenosine(37)-N6)-threonylcarbamoyltransferase complex dimerization subunit type 1 TsaB, partial [Gemmatimonadetes bacterium]
MVVALETSTTVGSVAVVREGRIAGGSVLLERGRHASRLVPSLSGLMHALGLARSDIGGVIVGAGPGSFTGVRVAAATAKGLAHALGVPLWAYSSLEAAAATLDEPEAMAALTEGRPSPGLPAGEARMPRYVLFDARADRVYAACYAPTGDGPGAFEPLVPPRATTLAALLAGTPPAALFCGDGAWRHRDELRGAGLLVLDPPAGVPLAAGLARLWLADPAPSPIDDPHR